MLSPKLLNAFKFSKDKLSRTSCVCPLSTSGNPLRLRDVDRESLREEKKLKEWRAPVGVYTPFFKNKDSSSFFDMFKVKAEMTPWGLKKHFKDKFKEHKRQMQHYNPNLHDNLGADIAAAHFLLNEGGRLKFKGNDEWLSLKSIELPSDFDPSYVLTAIDASGLELFYEALDNFRSTPRVKQVIFNKSPLCDDWFVDKFSSIFPNMEYLDISECPKVSERALEALYKNSDLKTILITNHRKSAAFELTCMMLEDCVPGLTVQILEPKGKEPGIKKV